MATKNLELIPLYEWGMFTEPRPSVVAGPCSAESEEQVMETAKGLREMGINVYRAGIWKPRTHPGSFEGAGAEGLRWMQKAKREYGLKIATEVASEKHVFECLKFGVDLVWLGARTTSNPFLVQEIADALKDTDIPVLVKNPANPDLDLWIGALERLNRAGIKKLGVIHRGLLRKYRKHAVVVLMVLAAVITPSGDAFTLFMVALPLYMLYEMSILMCKEKVEEAEE